MSKLNKKFPVTTIYKCEDGACRKALPLDTMTDDGVLFDSLSNHHLARDAAADRLAKRLGLEPGSITFAVFPVLLNRGGFPVLHVAHYTGLAEKL